MKLFENEFDLGKVQIISVKNPEPILFRLDKTGNPIVNDCIYSRPQVTFRCLRPVENQNFYEIYDDAGNAHPVSINKSEPRDGGFVVSANFLPQ
jgi:hypothetical protein